MTVALLIVSLAACTKPVNSASSVIKEPAPIDFTGIWQAQSNDVLKPANGQSIPFKPEAARTVASYQASARRGDFSWDVTSKCTSPGMPRIMVIAQPFEIIQDRNVIAMTFQYQGRVRFAYLGDLHPTTVDDSYLGESQAHWDANTLVIETRKLKTDTVLDSTGIPHGPKLQLTERWQPTTPDTVIDHITIQDDDMFTQPWQVDVVLKKLTGVQVQDIVCVEREAAHQ